MSHQNNLIAHPETYIRNIQERLYSDYSFPAEQLREITDWGAIIRSVIDNGDDCDIYAVAWHLRGDRLADLPPEKQFEGLPRIDGEATEEMLVAMGSVASTTQVETTVAV